MDFGNRSVIISVNSIMAHLLQKKYPGIEIQQEYEYEVSITRIQAIV